MCVCVCVSACVCVHGPPESPDLKRSLLGGEAGWQAQLSVPRHHVTETQLSPRARVFSLPTVRIWTAVHLILVP